MVFWKKNSSALPAPSFAQGAGIAFKNVTCMDSEGQRAIVSDVTCDLKAPSTAVLGLNGSGKSSLLKLVNGIYSPAFGQVLVDGVEVAGHEAAVRSRVGLLFSNPLAQLIMPTPTEDVELSLRSIIADPVERKARALELLESRGLGHRAHASVYDLSGGEQQLVALTSVLAVEPSILLLDEPTTLLDLRNRSRLIDLLGTLDQQLVISTHDLELAETCQQAIIVSNGRVIAQGAGPEMVTIYRNWCAVGFPDEETEPAGQQSAGSKRA
ncbi:energy-coupling factor ABC transporter ATP-binding protein [Rothia aerolata]|uniref:ABC transporter ATP-binding protein n=1 Tax=Rothia aerolata TaxID=1812262 RepID=A0A917IMU4_9MICC|nr:ABC transporter ATP-binding protein [Rothia aerolata]GGH57307.1 ABC transporter ATP-binding protein [Rothia aerolata]